MNILKRQFVPFSDIPAEEWDHVVLGSPDGWVFGLSGWQRLILAVDRWALRDHSFALRENGELAAVMPLQFNPATRRMTSSGWGGTGPIINGGRSGGFRERTLRLMFDHARDMAIEVGANVLDFVTSPVTRSSLASRWGVNPFVYYGYQDVSQISQVVDLSKSEDELFKELSENAKRLIKRARHRGVHVESVSWPEYIDEYYQLHCETYQRTGVPPHSKQYFSGIATEMWPAKFSVLHRAVLSDRGTIAFHNTAIFGVGAFYHTGCSTSDALSIGANHLLMWEAILAAKNQGALWFDVGPVFPDANSGKLEGLTSFKTKFGGEPHRFFRCEMPLPAASASEEESVTELACEPVSDVANHQRDPGVVRNIIRRVSFLRKQK